MGLVEGEGEAPMTCQIPYEAVLVFGLFANVCKWWSIVMLIPVS